MSSQLKEKQQQKDNKRDLDADGLFNQHLFNTLAYAGAGFGAGLVASVFFKHRKALTLLGAGSGAAYGASNFMNELNQFNKFKSYANQSSQSNTLKREDQLSTKNWEDFMPKQESQTQLKRHGGSDDDDDKGSKSSTNKSIEKKTQTPSPSHPLTQGIHPSSSLETKPTGSKESPNLNPKSSHDKTLDKSSYDFGKGKGVNAHPAGHHQSESHKSSGSKSSSSSHKESDKTSQEQHKGESQKNFSQSKDQHTSKKFDSLGSSHDQSKIENLEPGQHLQDFKTNKGAGKPAPGESAEHRNSERPLHRTNQLNDYFQDQQHRSEQDRWGLTTHTGLKQYNDFVDDSKAGAQFNEKGLTAKDQVNAVIE